MVDFLGTFIAAFFGTIAGIVAIAVALKFYEWCAMNFWVD